VVSRFAGQCLNESRASRRRFSSRQRPRSTGAQCSPRLARPSKLRNVSGTSVYFYGVRKCSTRACKRVRVSVCSYAARVLLRRDSPRSIGEFPISSISRLPTGRSPAGFPIARIKLPVRRASSPRPRRPRRFSPAFVLARRYIPRKFIQRCCILPAVLHLSRCRSRFRAR